MSINSPKSNEVISNSDYYLPSHFCKTYIPDVERVIHQTVESLQQIFKPTNAVVAAAPELTWFQQYKEGDYHGWHSHGGNVFYSCVYYVDLPDNSPVTTLRILDEEKEYSVKEGDVFCFPGLIEHCSKPNKSKKIKTSIAFNTFLKYNQYCNL